MRWVGNALTRRKGVGVFGSALLRREGVRGFGFGIGCSGVIQMTRDGRRQVGVGRIGVGTVTVVTHAHINQIKDPAQGSNNNNYNPQICHQLDRLEKCRDFELAMSLKDPDLQLDTSTGIMDNEQDDGGNGTSGTSQPVTDYFTRSFHLASLAPDTIPLPRCTLSVGSVAINLAYDPHIRRMSIDDAARQFQVFQICEQLSRTISLTRGVTV